jgi:hypothetical protein
MTDGAGGRTRTDMDGKARGILSSPTAGDRGTRGDTNGHNQGRHARTRTSDLRWSSTAAYPSGGNLNHVTGRHPVSPPAGPSPPTLRITLTDYSSSEATLPGIEPSGVASANLFSAGTVQVYEVRVFRKNPP